MLFLICVGVFYVVLFQVCRPCWLGWTRVYLTLPPGGNTHLNWKKLSIMSYSSNIICSDKTNLMR